MLRYVFLFFQKSCIGETQQVIDFILLNFVKTSKKTTWTKPERTMQRDATLLHKWLCPNVLTINITKTRYMTWLQYQDRQEKIKRLRTYLPWISSGWINDSHIKISSGPLMCRKGKYITADKRKQLYDAYVQSCITYIWPSTVLVTKRK